MECHHINAILLPLTSAGGIISGSCFSYWLKIADANPMYLWVFIVYIVWLAFYAAIATTVVITRKGIIHDNEHNDL